MQRIVYCLCGCGFPEYTIEVDLDGTKKDLEEG